MERVNSYLRHHDQSANAVREVIAVFLERQRIIRNTENKMVYIDTTVIERVTGLYYKGNL